MTETNIATFLVAAIISPLLAQVGKHWRLNLPSRTITAIHTAVSLIVFGAVWWWLHGALPGSEVWLIGGLAAAGAGSGGFGIGSMMKNGVRKRPSSGAPQLPRSLGGSR